MSDKKVSVAIVGAGLIGKKRAQALLNIKQASLVGILDLDEKSAQEFASEFNCKIYSYVDEILADKEVTLVNLAISHKAAAQLAPKILAQKDLLLEKPLGRNLAETKQIIKAAESSKTKLFGGFNYRFYPHVTLLKAYLSEKKLGELISSTFKIGHAAFPGYENTWKMSKELCGGGVVLDPGIHLIDLMVYLFGEPESLDFNLSTLGWGKEVEDEAFINFVYQNKFVSNHHYSLNLSQNTFEIEVVGTKGIARLTGRGGNYGTMEFKFIPRWFWKDSKEVISKNFGGEDLSFAQQVESIVLAIQNNNKLDYKEYLVPMELLEKIY